MIGMYLTQFTSQSKLHIGGYDQAVVDKSIAEQGRSDLNPDGIFWMKINSFHHWQVKIYKATIGDAELKVTVDNCIFDSGASLMFVPAVEYSNIMAAIKQTHTCDETDESGLEMCRCGSENDADFPRIKFLVGSHKGAHWF